VQLVDLDSSLIFKSFLIIINYVELVFIVLQKHPAVVDEISHVTLKVQHDASHFFHDLVNGQDLMTHLLELWGAFPTDTDASCLIKVRNLVHVVIRAWIRDAGSTRHSR
jgi:hypothetical protein